MTCFVRVSEITRLEYPGEVTWYLLVTISFEVEPGSVGFASNSAELRADD
jgi:hypothetical protein